MSRRPRRARSSSTLAIVAVALIVAVIVAVALVANSALQDNASGSSDASAASSITTAAQAIDGLGRLTVKASAGMTGYSRDQFGPAWKDVDHNGCDTRNDILKRDLIDVSFQTNSKCIITKGTLNDPYTGKVIAFTRGQTTSDDVQIDHVVALGDAWQTGAAAWSDDKRLQLANDPLELIAVDGPTNQAKSDKDAATWLPPNAAFRCRYATLQVAVKVKYQLWVTQAEHDALASTLAACPPGS